jgi:multicomponent Na+:H+ antiporter subunit D
VFEAAATRYVETPTIAAGAVLLALLVGAVLTIMYTTRTWTRSFWGEQTPAVTTAAVDRSQLSILAVLALLILVVGVGFDPVYEFASAAAEAALDSEAYVDAVAPQGGAAE